MAYVYRHIRLDKNEPFYIGIGSEEFKKYLSEINSGSKHPRYGKSVSQETRDRLSVAISKAYNPRSRKVIDTSTGKQYKCILDAVQDSIYQYGTLYRKLMGTTVNNTTFKLT